MDTRGDSHISVVLVDDHDLFRSGLAAMLRQEPDIAIVGQASRAASGIRLTLELRPHVVLMALRMPDVDGIEATQEIVAGSPETRVLILATVSGICEVEATILAGACGFLLKDASVTDVAAAVRSAAEGESWLAPRAASAVLRSLRRGHIEASSEPAPDELLSAREIEVLALVARGFDNAKIARELCISPSTAKNHLSHVHAKLGINNRVQAAIYALHHGLSRDLV